MSEGSAVLLRVSLSIIAGHSEALLRCRSTTEILDVFRAVSTSPNVTRCHQFMQVSTGRLGLLQHVWPNRDLTGQRLLDWFMGFFLWHVTTFKSFLGADRHSLYAVLCFCIF